MVYIPKDSTHISPIQGPNIQAGHEMIFNSKKTTDLFAEMKADREAWTPNQASLQMFPTKQFTTKTTAAMKKAGKKAIQVIERFGEHVKGHSPSLQGSTQQEQAPTNKRKKV